MEEADKKNHYFPPSFYDKYIQEDENMQAKIKPILNQIQENRVTVKELHTQFGVRFSGMINSYRNRMEELKGHYDRQISDLRQRQNSILNKCNDILEELKRPKT